MDPSFLAGATLVLVLLAIIIAILWILLPFAVFGLKPLVREVLQEQKRTNMLLAHISDARTPSQANPADKYSGR